MRHAAKNRWDNKSRRKKLQKLKWHVSKNCKENCKAALQKIGHVTKTQFFATCRKESQKIAIDMSHVHSSCDQKCPEAPMLIDKKIRHVTLCQICDVSLWFCVTITQRRVAKCQDSCKIKSWELADLFWTWCRAIFLGLLFWSTVWWWLIHLLLDEYETGVFAFRFGLRCGDGFIYLLWQE
jgi:hypothetical protein